jgi:hypothetical protein
MVESVQRGRKDSKTSYLKGVPLRRSRRGSHLKKPLFLLDIALCSHVRPCCSIWWIHQAAPVFATSMRLSPTYTSRSSLQSITHPLPTSQGRVPRDVRKGGRSDSYVMKEHTGSIVDFKSPRVWAIVTG